MKYAILFVLVWASSLQAQSLKIMNWNTMCSLCDMGKGAQPYGQRIKDLADTVKRHNPDLISFQEFTFRHHVKKMSRLLGNQYTPIYKRWSLYPATDAVLFVRKSRFKIGEKNGMWLGPAAPHFSFGWSFRIPRRFETAVLTDLKSGQSFVFVGSHFDNSFSNKNRSADYAQKFFAAQTLPVIFAGDSNLQMDYEAYKTLLGSNMVSTFDEEKPVVVTANSPYSQADLCHDRINGDPWPKCHIDHVLISKSSPWIVKSWGEDLFRYYKGQKFASDHRAVIVELETRH